MGFSISFSSCRTWPRRRTANDTDFVERDWLATSAFPELSNVEATGDLLWQQALTQQGLALIATDRFGWLQRCEPIQPELAQDARDGRWRYRNLGGDLLARVVLSAQRPDRGTRDHGGWAWQ